MMGAEEKDRSVKFVNAPRTLVPNWTSCFCSVSIESGQAIIALHMQMGISSSLSHKIWVNRETYAFANTICSSCSFL